MSSAGSRYEALLGRARFAVNEGDQLTSQRAYYSARDGLTCAPVKGDGLHDRRPRAFRGKITRGRCVDARDPDAPEPHGLSAQKIEYVCRRRPRRSKVYPRSRAHRGQRGLIERDVCCTILASYYVNG